MKNENKKVRSDCEVSKVALKTTKGTIVNLLRSFSNRAQKAGFQGLAELQGVYEAFEKEDDEDSSEE